MKKTTAKERHAVAEMRRAGYSVRINRLHDKLAAVTIFVAQARKKGARWVTPGTTQEEAVLRLSERLSKETCECPPVDSWELWLHPTWQKRTAGSLAKHLRSLADAAPILPGPNAGRLNLAGCKLPCRVPSSERLKAGHLAKPAERWLAEPGGKERKELPLTVDVVRDMFAEILATRSPKALTKRRLLDVLRKEAPC